MSTTQLLPQFHCVLILQRPMILESIMRIPHYHSDADSYASQHALRLRPPTRMVILMNSISPHHTQQNLKILLISDIEAATSDQGHQSIHHIDSTQDQSLNKSVHQEENYMSDQDQQKKSFNLSDHQEPTADDDEYTTPKLSGTLQGLGSSTSDDRASTSDRRNNVEVQSLLVPAQSKQSTQSSHSHTRTQYNQTKELPPDVPQERIPEVLQCLIQISRQKKARITKLYDAMQTRQIAKAMQKSCNAKHFPPISPDTHHPTAKLESKHHVRKKGKANVKADQIASLPCTSPTLLFSEGLAPSSL
ncbi:hypothetical protein PGT21_001165 [Puccinia graminis f. sp. tritici]|uniref:Uncharacterized protein n=1 Tax=Puccinia graminis f. sp. tritici TaxID=56615 RepID=A0A5B0M0G6_PUCGR|nr:hypothetical protein PGTUg99_005262 [Puccinia graminis f. sp. tritici]KAA1071250.1 hypothetical protein PGT21_001165 [Puccinia graminis f. sp. tritici]